MDSFLIGLAAGLAATPHCLGMCGGFALHLARDRPVRGVLVREFSFLLGKAFTYAFLGALTGALGAWVVQTGWVPGLRQALVYGAAVATVILGFLMLELPLPIRRHRTARASSPCAPLSKTENERRDDGSLVSPGTAGASPAGVAAVSLAHALPAFALGLAVGFLPCPLTGVLMLRAVAEQSVAGGLILLGGAGVGTMPGLLAAGLAGSAVHARWRTVGTKVLGGLVILLGVLMLLRRLGLLPGGHTGACH